MLIIILILIAIALRTGRILAKRAIISVVPKNGGVVDVREALCRSCVNAHVRIGFGGEERIACNFGGELTPVEFLVSECSGYASKNAPIRIRVAGFVRDEDESDYLTVIRIA